MCVSKCVEVCLISSVCISLCVCVFVTVGRSNGPGLLTCSHTGTDNGQAEAVSRVSRGAAVLSGVQQHFLSTHLFV